jgi:hypothetical protein
LDEQVRLGGVAILRLGFGRLALTAPVRVVDVIDEEKRRGFAYATLPGHPVCGEELFLLSRDIPDVITAAVTAVSRPAGAAMRLAGPMGRWGQRTIAGRYAREMIRGFHQDGSNRHRADTPRRLAHPGLMAAHAVVAPPSDQPPSTGRTTPVM